MQYTYNMQVVTLRFLDFPKCSHILLSFSKKHTMCTEIHYPGKGSVRINEV